MKPGEVKKQGPGLRPLVLRLQELAKKSVLVGIQGDYASDGPQEAASLPGIAARLEYGEPSERLPARPWMATTADKYGKEWAVGLRKIVKFVTLSDDPQKELEGFRIIGTQAVGNMQDTLREGPWAPNAEFTKRQKWEKGGRPGPFDSFVSQPLIDSGQLVQSHRAVLQDGDKVTLLG